MSASLPSRPADLIHWSWPEIEPHYHSLFDRPLTADSVAGWLADWSRLTEHVSEMQSRLYVATTLDTADAAAGQRYMAFLDEIYPASQAAEQRLKEKLLASGLEPAGFAIPLRNMRAEAALFREANLPLLAAEQKLVTDFDRLIGAQTVMWDGQELTLPQLLPLYLDPDRSARERAWRLGAERQLADRQAIDALWGRFLQLRLKLAAQAGCGDNYRAFRWQQLLRFDYTPDDCRRFHAAIEEVAVPAAERVYERRRRNLGVPALRPWDLADGWYGRPIDPPSHPPLRPFQTVDELRSRTAAIFQRLDPELGACFDAMARDGRLDLDNRKNKAPGGYCIEFAVERQPFIFTNVVGLHEDVQTLFHEAGHAFHVFETGRLPYYPQRHVTSEFAEVASMGMELLAAPYLAGPDGFYTEAEAARARVEHLERAILFWPFMAAVDAFQHWVYEHPGAALDPAQCDAAWSGLWDRFIRGVDWRGLEQQKATGWHRKIHIHQDPFYYVEYGLAQLGAVQVWRNALRDQAQAVTAYRGALALGGTVPLPELYAAAGASFSFDAGTLTTAVRLIEDTIESLEQ